MKNTHTITQNNFCNQLNELRKQAISKLKNLGSKILFDTDSDDMDEIWDLPSIQYVDKYNFYSNYAIISYKVENDKIVFVGLETGEIGDIVEFDEQEIGIFDLCQIADELDKDNS